MPFRPVFQQILLTIFVILLNLSVFKVRISADEGMWLFSNPPRREVLAKYNFRITDSFLEHLQKSSIRFSNGGSGSFVSSNGLIMTNHHVAYSAIQKLSSAEKDYLKKGFYAKKQEEELKCSDLELIVLDLIQDVTEQVSKAVGEKTTTAESETARRAIISRIEEAAFKQIADKGLDKSKYRCEVVPLYQGAVYHLYIYQKLEDIRLVLAPEESAGFFGGEPDNFEYPRYVLDMSFFRAYQNGKPYKPSDFLAWSPNGAQEGELVFVSGHPGHTDRLKTAEHLMFQRDIFYPRYLNRLRRREILLQSYAERGPEEALRVAGELFRLKNSRKNRSGILLGLHTPALLSQKVNDDKKLYEAVSQKKLIDLQKNNPWNYISDALDVWSSLQKTYDMFEDGNAFDSKLFQIARGIVRYAEEKEKTNEARLREYRDSALDAFREKILSSDPIYKDLEMLRLADSLGLYLESLDLEYASDSGAGLKLLNGKSPKEMAASLVYETKLQTVTERNRLLEVDLKTLKKSTDPMIQFALKIDPIAREVRTSYEQQVVEPLQQAYSMLSRARFEAFGMSNYPDATFTLRLSFGKMAGYTEDNGEKIPFCTDFNGAFEHEKEHKRVAPFRLPESWHQAKNAGKIDLKTPLNCVSTNDIIGGNSGSPLVNSKGEVVGLIFDGNVQSLVSNFIYSEKQGRALSVHSSGIREGLKYIYKADRIVNELGR